MTTTSTPAKGDALVERLSRLLDEGFAALDLTAETAKLAAVRDEIGTVKEAKRRADEEDAEVRAKLNQKRLGRPDDDSIAASAAASAYISGTAAEEIETETSLQSRREALEAIKRGLRDRLTSLSARERTAEGELEAATASAAAAARAALMVEAGRLFQQLQVISGISKVIATAARDRACGALSRRVEGSVTSWNRERGRDEDMIEPLGETPPWLLKVLTKHRDKVAAGRGTIAQYVTPPRPPREPREERSARDEDYEPGLGGGAALRGNHRIGGIPMTNL